MDEKLFSKYILLCLQKKDSHVSLKEHEGVIVMHNQQNTDRHTLNTWQRKAFMLILACFTTLSNWNVQIVAVSMSTSVNVSLHWLLEIKCPVSGATITVNKCKCEIKMHLLKQPCHYSLLQEFFELFYYDLCLMGFKFVQHCTRPASQINGSHFILRSNSHH